MNTTTSTDNHYLKNREAARNADFKYSDKDLCYLLSLTSTFYKGNPLKRISFKLDGSLTKSTQIGNYVLEAWVHMAAYLNAELIIEIFQDDQFICAIAVDESSVEYIGEKISQCIKEFNTDIIYRIELVNDKCDIIKTLMVRQKKIHQHSIIEGFSLKTWVVIASKLDLSVNIYEEKENGSGDILSMEDILNREKSKREY